MARGAWGVSLHPLPGHTRGVKIRHGSELQANLFAQTCLHKLVCTNKVAQTRLTLLR